MNHRAVATRAQIEELRRLVHDSSYRESSQRVLLQGTKLLREWIASGKKIFSIFKTKESPPLSGNDYSLSASILGKAVGLDSPALIYHVGVVEKPKSFAIDPQAETLVLDGLQDPGNVGTLIRSAKAFGFSQILLLEPCCDPYHPKVMRSSQGALLQLDIKKIAFEECFLFLHQNSITPWVADAKSRCAKNLQDLAQEASKKPIWIVIGSEARGPRREFLEKGIPLYIPIDPSVESLNAAVAGSLVAAVVFQARSQRFLPRRFLRKGEA